MTDDATTPIGVPELTAHDRLGHRRGDDPWLGETWADPVTRVLPVSGGRVHARDGRPAWVSSAEAGEVAPGADGVRVLLGEHDGVHHFAWAVPGQQGEGWVGMWELARHLLTDGWDIRLAFHAVGMAEWLDRTRFCSRCGGALSPRLAGHVLACADCGREHFPRIEPAVIMLVTHGAPGSPEERCLLGRGVRWPEPRFSTLAGFAEPGESLEDAVRREVVEETGVRVGEVAWFGSQAWPFPSSLMLGFFGRAETTEISVDPAELADARWFTRAELAAEAERGEIKLPTRGISISRSLVEQWYGGPLPGSW